MAEHSPLDIIRHASNWSIIWGILLIVFGILAIGSPFLAAVAVAAVIAWLNAGWRISCQAKATHGRFASSGEKVPALKAITPIQEEPPFALEGNSVFMNPRWKLRHLCR